VTVPGADKLLADGSNLFSVTPSSGAATPTSNATIHQGALEGSNVDVATEMVRMVTTQRSYQLESSAIQTENQMMSIANELRLMNAASQISACSGHSRARGGHLAGHDRASEPAGVRDGSPKAKQAYETARGFEEVLMQQLSQELVKSSGLEGEAAVRRAAKKKARPRIALGRGEGTLSSFLPQVLSEAPHAWRNTGYCKSADGRARPLRGESQERLRRVLPGQPLRRR